MKISIIKMKKHPIDELFAKKLAEHRQEPSQKAFEKFQARLQEKQIKRRGGVFAINRNWGYYAAAAGVVAALTIGILSQRNAVDTQVFADNGKPKEVKAFKQPVSKGIEENKEAIASTESEKITNTYRGVAGSAQGVSLAKTTEEKSTYAPVLREEIVPLTQEPDKAIALNQPQEVPSTLVGKNTTAVESFAQNNTADIAAKYNIGESVVLIIAPLEESLKENTAEAELSVEEKAEKEKSFLAKLYGEYKHFKYGEKVDLKRLGVKDAMARVDEGLFKEEREDVRDFVQRRIGRIQKRE
jgi:hypothetical protein